MEYRVVVNTDGTFWYKPGTKISHREDGPAMEWSSDNKYWYKNGKCHRDDGPAIEWADGSKCWYLDGKLHRDDGPAIEYTIGDKFWYLDGVNMSEEEFLVKTQPVKELTVTELENLLGYRVKIVK